MSDVISQLGITGQSQIRTLTLLCIRPANLPFLDLANELSLT